MFPSFDVLGFGALAVDDLLYVDVYPSAESKVRVHRQERQCGGLTGTALVAAARLGARCAYAGLLGDDDLSCFVAGTLDREDVDLDHAVRRPGARPAHSTIIVGCRRPTRTVFCRAAGALGPDEMLPEAGLIRAARTVHIDHHGMEGTLRICRVAREAGVGIVADLERDGGGLFRDVLALVDHLIVPRRFAEELTGFPEPQEAVKRLWHSSRQAVVVTCGGTGCWYIGDGLEEARHLPAFAVDAVDTTGCGDVFHGAYAAMLARRLPLDARIRAASAAAAMKARHRGGQAGCPTREQLDAFLEQ